MIVPEIPNHLIFFFFCSTTHKNETQQEHFTELPKSAILFFPYILSSIIQILFIQKSEGMFNRATSPNLVLVYFVFTDFHDGGVAAFSDRMARATGISSSSVYLVYA